MGRFAQGFRTTATQNAVLELIAGASDRAHLVELGLTLCAQTLTPVGLGYPAAIGVTPSSSVTFLSEADGATCEIKAALAWNTPPTTPSYFYRRATLGLGNDELVWTWPAGGGLLLLPSTSLVLWLFAVGSALDGWAVFEQ